MEREHACLFSNRERDLVCGGDDTIPQPHAASAQSQPTQEQISHAHSPFSRHNSRPSRFPLPLLRFLKILRPQALTCIETTRQVGM